MKRIASVLLAVLLITLCALPAYAASGDDATVIILSDSGIKVNGSAASTDSSSAVYTGAAIVYYEAGHDATYGEGTSADEHSASEAKAHTVVTITQPGTYRISGKLSAGQIAVDLGSGAKNDPTAVVTLILDGADITCTVAPAVIFYNVYECGVKDTAAASATVDTSKAGANVVIADGTVNNINGSYVARIYKEGTTSKLHKYDGAFHSKMSMNVSGTGTLNITAANEGLDSELHLTINGGIININAQNDGINTNEDGVSVTTINGGTLNVNGGFGAEGDGIDSNGYLVINGGTIIASANPSTGDGGIDADLDILINGGTVIALGSRNDAASTNSKQAFMELSYASTQKAGTVIRLEDTNGSEIITYTPDRNYQSVTISTPKLANGTTYYLYANGIQQQYSGTGMTGQPGGGGMTPPDGTGQPPDETRPERPDNTGTPPEGFTPGQQMPEGFTPGQMPDGQSGQTGQNVQSGISGEGSVNFTLTTETRSFGGISDSANASGKTAVSFTVNGGKGMSSVSSGGKVELSGVTAVSRTGVGAVSVPASDIQLTITDVPSEDYAKSCLLSDGTETIASILPTNDGTYQLTISVLSGNTTYTGTSQWMFSIGSTTFTDVDANSVYYDAIQFVADAGLMAGTGNNKFSPDVAVSRAMAITVLGRFAKAEIVESTVFTDMEAGSWYAPYVGWAEKNAIVQGYGNGLFGPNDSVTRQQMCVILYNYAKSAGISLQSSALTYTDASQIASWAYEAIEACAASGLLDKVAAGGTALNPTAALTRAELADMLMRFAKL